MTEWESWDNRKGWTNADFVVTITRAISTAEINKKRLEERRQISSDSGDTTTRSVSTIGSGSSNISKERLSVNEVFQEVT